MLQHKITKHILKWLLFFLAIFLVLTVFTVGIYLGFDYKYQNRIYPGIYINNIHLGGLTTESAITYLNKKVDYLNQNGIIVNCQQKEATLYPLIVSTESDLAYEIIIFNLEETVNAAFDTARGGSFLKNLTKKIELIVHPININTSYTFNQEEINSFFTKNFSKIEQPAQDAQLSYDKSEKEFIVLNEKNGKKINISEGVKLLKQRLDKLNNSQITLTITSDAPKIFKKDVLNIGIKAQEIINNAPISLTYNDEKWSPTKELLTDWLKLKTNPNNSIQKVIIGLDEEKLTQYLIDNIAKNINIKPSNAKFEISNGKVIEFQTSQDGKELNLKSSFEKIENEFINESKNEIELAISELKSELQTEEVNDLGIKELIGTGESNFSGSPSNRRHNIKTGADAVNGTLIKPGDEFSLVKTLGDINKASGYLPELVIKNNQTITEYGGGLCQVGTTLFRSTINTGLPVTARRNHSYRVSYYEPAGTDATIYDPWPDYKFKNDTENHVLIQSRIEGDYLYFDFWGTNDGRVATNTYPVIYNIVRPGATKIIETTKLEPGVKKCTEHAHNGADAYFDYTVTYPDGEVTEERFKSHYVPWRAVCLLGVKELTVDKKAREKKEALASSTAEVIE